MTDAEVMMKLTKDYYKMVHKLERIRKLAQEIEDTYHDEYNHKELVTKFEEKSIHNAVEILNLIDDQYIDGRL